MDGVRLARVFFEVWYRLAVSRHLFGLFGRLFRYRWPSCFPQDEITDAKRTHKRHCFSDGELAVCNLANSK